MTQINWARILLGSLLAGVVINTFEFVSGFFVLDEAWRTAQVPPPEATGPLMTGGQIVALNLWGFLVGFVALWLYAAIRPRYGSGPKTALCAGTAVWALASLLATIKPTVGNNLSAMALFIAVAVGLAEINLGTLLGAWQYRDTEREAWRADSPNT